MLEVAEVPAALRCRRAELGLAPLVLLADGAAFGPLVAPAEAVLLIAAAFLQLTAALLRTATSESAPIADGPSGEAVGMLAVEAVRGILMDVMEAVRRFFMSPRPEEEPKPQGVPATVSPPAETVRLLPAEFPPEEPPEEAGGRGSDEKLTFRVSEDALLSLPSVAGVRPPSNSRPSGRAKPRCG